MTQVLISFDIDNPNDFPRIELLSGGHSVNPLNVRPSKDLLTIIKMLDAANSALMRDFVEVSKEEKENQNE